jgi:phosphoserine phosphatase
MTKENARLICFDVDGTLIDNKSSWLTITQGLGCSVSRVLAIYEAAMKGEIPFPEGERRVADIYRATGKATKQFIEEIFSKEVFKPGAFEITKYLKEKGSIIWLVSGAIDIYVASVADRIGADGFFAHSSLEFDDKGVLLKISYSGDQNPWKAAKVRELSEKFDIPIDEIIFVGDSINDIEAFKLTGKGIAVYPYNEKLAKVAWKTVGSLPEIKNILE